MCLLPEILKGMRSHGGPEPGLSSHALPTSLGPANHAIQSTLLQVLNPKTLVGSQLTPPVGLAKDWMWGRGNLRAALTEALGEEGRHCSAAPHID